MELFLKQGALFRFWEAAALYQTKYQAFTKMIYALVHIIWERLFSITSSTFRCDLDGLLGVHVNQRIHFLCPQLIEQCKAVVYFGNERRDFCVLAELLVALFYESVSLPRWVETGENWKLRVSQGLKRRDFHSLESGLVAFDCLLAVEFWVWVLELDIFRVVSRSRLNRLRDAFVLADVEIRCYPSCEEFFWEELSKKTKDDQERLHEASNISKEVKNLGGGSAVDALEVIEVQDHLQ